MSETMFKERVQRDLDSLNCYHVKIQQRALRGIPDILACINGNFVALELKKDSVAHIDKLQYFELSKIQKKGKGLAFIVCPENWEETFKLLSGLIET